LVLVVLVVVQLLVDQIQYFQQSRQLVVAVVVLQEELIQVLEMVYLVDQEEVPLTEQTHQRVLVDQVTHLQ
jgi:hypothetical protein